MTNKRSADLINDLKEQVGFRFGKQALSLEGLENGLCVCVCTCV